MASMLEQLRSTIDGVHNHQSGPDQSSIIVEEGFDCRSNSRFFNLINRQTKLDIIVSKSSSIISCKLDGHEIVLNSRQYNQTHETWAIGERPYQKICSILWSCHVRGAELFLSNGPSSIMYELTRLNELNSLVKLKSIHLQPKATYFNLNNAREKVPIDGHTLIVQCNGNMSRIQVQSTKLLCQCNRKASILPQSLVGDIPFELVQHDASMSLNLSNHEELQANLGTEDDKIVCDAIFSIESTSALDFLSVKLQYHSRSLVFEVRAVTSASSASSNSNNTSHNNNNASVSSSTASTTSTTPTDTTRMTQSDDLAQNYQTQQASSSSSSCGDGWQSASQVTSESRSTTNDGNDSKHSSPGKWLSSFVEQPSTSCKASQSSSNATNSSGITSNSHQSTILRARVRVTNFGVCIMPLMMTNYSCKYRFSW